MVGRKIRRRTARRWPASQIPQRVPAYSLSSFSSRPVAAAAASSRTAARRPPFAMARRSAGYLRAASASVAGVLGTGGGKGELLAAPENRRKQRLRSHGRRGARRSSSPPPPPSQLVTLPPSSPLPFSNLKPSKARPVKFREREGQYAASTGQVQWLQISLQKADAPTQSDIKGFSTLHTAALHGRLDCIKMLIERFNADVNQASLRGWRPIHLVLGQESKDMALECLQYLLNKGADVNVQNQNGISPLHKAASEGRELCLQVLIKAGADVHSQDSEGQKPIDLCKMWGHRNCAKHLSHAMWKADKRHRMLETCRLEAIKMDCELKRRILIQKEQRDLNILNTLAFEQWLTKKGFPLPARSIMESTPFRRHSVSLCMLAGKLTKPITSFSTLPVGQALELSKRWKYRRQKPWNFSTNLATEPVTCISRPNIVRLGVEPEKPMDHDFTTFLFLYKNNFGEPVIQIDNIGKVTSIPDLPYDVIESSLYSHMRATRLDVPKDLQTVSIFNLKHRRPAGPEQRWTDQMALSLRQTLDPIFLSTLQSHFSTDRSTLSSEIKEAGSAETSVPNTSASCLD